MSKKTISGFTTTYNCYEMHYPFVECIESLLGFCDEVSIVDAGSTDGTIETLRKLQAQDSRIKLAVEPVDFSHPRWAIYQDGYLKAKARANCTGDFCWQTDTDEIVAEHDFAKIRELPDRMGDTKLIMLPMIEFWGDLNVVRGDFFSWKPRFSVNDPRITHGIPKDLRCYDGNGHEYPRPFDSDTCNYIYRDTLEDVPIVIPVDNDALKNVGLGSPQHQKLYFDWLDQLPAVFHVSWLDLRRKVLHYKTLWRKFHASMYNLNIEDTAANNVMFDKPWSEVNDSDIAEKAEELKNLGPRFFHKKMDTQKKGLVIPFNRPVPTKLVQWYQNELKQYQINDATSHTSVGQPLVSAVVPSFNQARYVRDALTSLAAQNYQNLEILVVNDGSNAETEQVVADVRKEFPNKNISLINKANGGTAEAKNFGIRQARGTYVMVMDAEDLLKPEYISKGIHYIKSNGANLFYSNVECAGDKQGQWVPENFDPYFIRYKNSIPKSALFARRLWTEVGGFKVSMPFSEDWDFWLNCSKKDLKPCRAPETLFIDRTYAGFDRDINSQNSALIKQSLMCVSNDDLYSIEEVTQAHEDLKKCASEWAWTIEGLERQHKDEWLLKLLTGLKFESQGNFGEAMPYYGIAIEKSFYKKWQPLYRLALILEGLGKSKEALEFYHSVRSLRPDMGKLVNSKIQGIEKTLTGTSSFKQY